MSPTAMKLPLMCSSLSSICKRAIEPTRIQDDSEHNVDQTHLPTELIHLLCKALLCRRSEQIPANNTRRTHAPLCSDTAKFLSSFSRRVVVSVSSSVTCRSS